MFSLLDTLRCQEPTPAIDRFKYLNLCPEDPSNFGNPFLTLAASRSRPAIDILFRTASDDALTPVGAIHPVLLSRCHQSATPIRIGDELLARSPAGAFSDSGCFIYHFGKHSHSAIDRGCLNDGPFHGAAVAFLTSDQLPETRNARRPGDLDFGPKHRGVLGHGRRTHREPGEKKRQKRVTSDHGTLLCR